MIETEMRASHAASRKAPAEHLGLETQQQEHRIRIDGYDRSGSSEAYTNKNRARDASRAVSVASLLDTHLLIGKRRLVEPRRRGGEKTEVRQSHP